MFVRKQSIFFPTFPRPTPVHSKNARQFSPVLKEDEFTADMLIDDLEDEKMLEKVAVALFARVAGVDQSDKSEKENQQFISELESLLEKYKKENK